MMPSSNAPFRPSPLSFNSPRASPFRRPSTPSSPPQGRPVTPGSSPSRGYTPVVSPSKLNQSYTVEDDASSRNRDPIPQPRFTREPLSSPSRNIGALESPPSSIEAKATSMMAATSDAAARLAPAQLREIREAFQVLDRDNDGFVDKDDVADVLANTGQDPSTLSQFFPPGGTATINFPTFLNTLSQLLSPLSSRQELINALSAFDEDDSGQVDVEELRDSLLNTAPDDGERPLTEREVSEVLNGFTSRRAFGGKGGMAQGGGKRGEVLRYQEFVNTVIGGAENGQSKRDA
ncbi:EF-hand [Aspergillus heterothallicus]